MAEETIILSSYDNSDSETSKILSEPATSSNKASTFPAEHNYDNEETPMKQLMLNYGHKKSSFRNNQKVTFEVWQWTLWKFIHIAFKMVMFTPIWNNWWGNLWKFTKFLLYATRVFGWEKFWGNINDKFDVFMKTICDFVVEANNKLFKNRTQKPTFVLCSFQKLLN